MTAQLEHINITVANADATAKRLSQLFGWRVRWAGASIHGGHSVHVGSQDQYLAVYSRVQLKPTVRKSYTVTNSLNHIGITVNNLEAAEARIIKAGYNTYSHGDYEPGRRFYFRDEDGVEYEVISYKSLGDPTRFWGWLGQLAQNAAMMK